MRRRRVSGPFLARFRLGWFTERGSTAKRKQVRSHEVLLLPIYYLRPSFSLSLLVVTRIRGHTAGSSPPLPTTAVRGLYFYREKISAPCCWCLHIKPFFLPNDLSSTPSVLPDSSS